MPASLIFRDASSRDVFTGDRAVRQHQPRLRPDVPRRAGHRRSAQRDARGRAERGRRRDAHLLPRHRAAHGARHPRHAGQAPRVRRRGRPDVLPEQRRSRRRRWTCCGWCSTRGASRRRPRTNALTIKDTPERIAAAARVLSRDRQGAARGHHRRRAARGRSHAAAGVRPADRVAGLARASTASVASTVDAAADAHACRRCAI